MSTPQEDLLAFERAMGGAINALPSQELLRLRMRLIREEYEEIREVMEPAMRDPRKLDIEHLAKELADILYVVFGTAVALGIDLDRAFKIVHRSNMSKLGPDGKPVLDAGGKVMKGPGYVAPDMSPAVQPIMEGSVA